MTYIMRHCESIFWLCLIAFVSILVTSSWSDDIDISRATITIGAPVLLIAAGRSVIEIGQLSRRGFSEGKCSLGRGFALLTVLGSGGVVILGLFIVDMIDRNLGSHNEQRLFSVDMACVFRLTFVIGSLLLFVAAGRGVIRIEQLSRRRFKERKRSLGGVFALLTVLASGGLVILGWIIVVFLMFALFYRQ